MKAKDRRNKCKCIIGKSECISCKKNRQSQKKRTNSSRISAFWIDKQLANESLHFYYFKQLTIYFYQIETLYKIF